MKMTKERAEEIIKNPPSIVIKDASLPLAEIIKKAMDASSEYGKALGFIAGSSAENKRSEKLVEALKDAMNEIKRKHELEMEGFTELQNMQHWDYIGTCKSCSVVKDCENLLEEYGKE